MKKALIILSCWLVTLFCSGQIDSVSYNDDSTDIVGWVNGVSVDLSIFSYKNRTTYQQDKDAYNKKPDTIPVIMLVCDTSKKYGIKRKDKVFMLGGMSMSSSLSYDWVTDSSNIGYNNSTLWLSGYVINKPIATGWVDGNIQYFPNQKFVKYLDQDKKELPYNIVVWDSKEIKLKDMPTNHY